MRHHIHMVERDFEHWDAPVFRDWTLPACFASFRAELEGHHGAAAGSRSNVSATETP